MNSVTAQAAELKLALEQLYKQAEEADAPDKKKPKYSYKPESKKQSRQRENKSRRRKKSGSFSNVGRLLQLCTWSRSLFS